MQDAAGFWNKAARRYAERPISDMAAYELTMERTRAHLRAGDEVLEVGCGTASTALLLAPHVARITASDFSSEMIAIGREKAAAAGVPNIDFLVAAPGDAALEGRRYDAVLAYNFLHLVDDLPATLRRLAALLKPGGRLISKSACLAGAWHLRPLIGAMQLVGKAPHVGYLRAEALDRAVEAAGLKIVESDMHPAGGRSRFIVARNA